MCIINSWADPEGDTGGPDPPLKNHKNIEIPINIDLEPIKITKLQMYKARIQ